MKLSIQQQNAICTAAGCREITQLTPMQSLWAGQGELARLSLSGSSVLCHRSLVVKQIAYNAQGAHPRGWNSRLSQQRKRHSYQVELHWYREYAGLVQQSARMPELVYSEASQQEMLLVLEDLAIDFPIRFTTGREDRPTDKQITSCIGWLAQFHARYLNHNGDGLWPIGGYWHLDTRPDERQAMPESVLKQSAERLDNKLRTCAYQTLIHGDAKLANFCFASSGGQVAGVDFQYVGKGPGVKDLMLLLSSVMPDQRLITEATTWVDHYFAQLSSALQRYQPEINANAVEAAWHPLYAVAWADFHRFLAGWSPEHWKIGSYCLQQTEQALTSG